MASSPNYFLPFFLLLSILGFAQARNSQFFNKIPATISNIDPPNYTQQDPNFLPENGNSYGLDHHVSEHEEGQGQDQLPSSTHPSIADESIQTSPNSVPDDFNPVAHLIQPQHLTTPSLAFTSQPNTYNYYNGDGDIFNGGEFQHQQGMSDTRFLENGKYFHDVNTDSYSSNHPFPNLRPKHDYSNMINYYSNHYYGDSRGGSYGLGKGRYIWRNDLDQDKFQGPDINNIP